ncbi:hypothetical protein CPB83DRAFT_841242 [Crepidotus variabilis]|uniref:F-box domain-containing protein n=1 Tax=Crepidotus variabilis TaxID=179855 RepID=A0A9P6BBQ4_9AGAR|nr:hypothetical protein CPB83DRAFT_841242 [Crepidotus variabilis]
MSKAFVALSGMHPIPDDVLWHVLCQNTPSNRHFYSAQHDDLYAASGCMETARFTSQVCRRWRRIMLSSTTIWSKIIDLSCLDGYTQPDQWLSEVIGKRTQGQNLHVYGQQWDFGFSLKLYDSGAVQVIIFLSRAQGLLQGFESILGENGPQWLRINSENPKPQAPIYKNLRVLSLSSPTVGNNHDEHVESEHKTFPCAPLLEVLAVEQRVLLESPLPLQYRNLPTLSLSHLWSLKVEVDLSVCLATLLHVLPSTKCAVDMSIWTFFHDEYPVTWLAAFEEIIWSHYSKKIITGEENLSHHFKPLSSFAKFTGHVEWFILVLLDEMDGLEVVFRDRVQKRRVEVAGAGWLRAIIVDATRITRQRCISLVEGSIRTIDRTLSLIFGDGVSPDPGDRPVGRRSFQRPVGVAVKPPDEPFARAKLVQSVDPSFGVFPE